MMQTRRLALGAAGLAMLAGLLTACSASAPNASSGQGAGQQSSSAPSSATASTPSTSTPATSAPATKGVIPPIPGGPTGPAHASVATVATVAVPVRLQIPSIGVDTSLQDLSVEPDGTLQSPSQWQVAGWYAGGVRPGDVGPAVIAGHVDSVNGPAVFYQLKALKPGAQVVVTRADHSVAHFTVGSTAEYPKRTFPSEAVDGPTALPVLRLVTCTGDFDYSARSYVDNLVVTANLS